MEYKQIDITWKKKLEKELKKDYFQKLKSFIQKERKEKSIFPDSTSVFKAFEKNPLDDVKVVILGQDPYHTRGMAVGEAFAVSTNSKIPPSLRNIYKEIKSDTGKEPGELLELSDQGVLLINTILTVEEGAPLSHKNIGWEKFTDEVLKILWESQKKIVFLLWGNHAKKKGDELFKGEMGHLVLKSGHPSPLSARYFFGCKHFTRANAFLKKERGVEIDWNKR